MNFGHIRTYQTAGALINSIKMFKIETINGSSFDLFPLCIPPFSHRAYFILLRKFR
jgi:hypothetical protein